jgi:hypothetical protein
VSRAFGFARSAGTQGRAPRGRRLVEPGRFVEESLLDVTPGNIVNRREVLRFRRATANTAGNAKPRVTPLRMTRRAKPSAAHFLYRRHLGGVFPRANQNANSPARCRRYRNASSAPSVKDTPHHRTTHPPPQFGAAQRWGAPSFRAECPALLVLREAPGHKVGLPGRRLVEPGRFVEESLFDVTPSNIVNRREIPRFRHVPRTNRAKEKGARLHSG